MPKIEETYFSTARSEMTRASAIPWFDRPSAMSSRTSRSRGVKLGERIAVPPFREERRDDDRVDGRPAFGDTVNGRDEVLHLADPVLEEVAGTFDESALGSLRDLREDATPTDG